jgi:hypothetical protein
VKSVRLLVVAFLITSVVGSAVPAFAQSATQDDWSRVMALKPGTAIRLSVGDSLPVERVFVDARESELTVRNGNAVQRVARADVAEIGVRSMNGRRVVSTILGAFSGFFLGGWFGGMLENSVAPCNCDDPGLRGALIGMPAGATVGGVVGYQLVRDKTYRTVYRK